MNISPEELCTVKTGSRLVDRDRKQDIQTALDLTMELADKLNGLHTDAFDYALFSLSKMR